MWPDSGGIRLTFPADPFAVRAALARLFAALPPDALDDDARGTAEIVIAEVLNNIVEHAYAGAPGEIEVDVRPGCGGLLCAITDHGIPLPKAVLPGLALPASDDDGLPEGGFGWFMIRALSQDVRYVCTGSENRLTFRVPVCNPAAGARIAD